MKGGEDELKFSEPSPGDRLRLSSTDRSLEPSEGGGSQFIGCKSLQTQVQKCRLEEVTCAWPHSLLAPSYS